MPSSQERTNTARHEEEVTESHAPEELGKRATNEALNEANEKAGDTVDDIDALLDELSEEIDEEQAQEIVDNFRQKGGQ